MSAIFPFLGGAIAGLLFLAIYRGPSPLDDTDNHTTGQRSEMRVLIDHGAGCQYLLSVGGGLTPRLDAAGKPICTAKEGRQ